MKKYDVIIIGAGPAGLTSALYTSRANLKTVILDRGLYGGQMNNTAGIENYPAFSDVLGGKLSKLMYKSATRFGAKYAYGDVKKIAVDKSTGQKVVKTSMGDYEAPVVIIATGAHPRHLNVVGENKYTGKGVSYCAVCDGNFFKNKPVVVVGGGNSAFSEAEYLSNIVHQVTIIIRKAHAQAEPEEINKAKNNKKIKIIYNHKVSSIYGNNTDNKGVQGVKLINDKTSDTKDFKTNAVFIYIGMIPNTKIFRNLGITNNNGWIKSNNKMQTKINGIYAVGDVRENQLRQIVTAVGDGGIAGHEAYKYLEDRH